MTMNRPSFTAVSAIETASSTDPQMSHPAQACPPPQDKPNTDGSNHGIRSSPGECMHSQRYLLALQQAHWSIANQADQSASRTHTVLVDRVTNITPQLWPHACSQHSDCTRTVLQLHLAPGALSFSQAADIDTVLKDYSVHAEARRGLSVASVL